MKTADIINRIKVIINDLWPIDLIEINPSTTFNELQADSLDLVEFVMVTEHEFNISIPDERIEGINTVNDAVQLVESLI